MGAQGLHRLGKRSTTELQPQPSALIFHSHKQVSAHEERVCTFKMKIWRLTSTCSSKTSKGKSSNLSPPHPHPTAPGPAPYPAEMKMQDTPGRAILRAVPWCLIKRIKSTCSNSGGPTEKTLFIAAPRPPKRLAHCRCYKHLFGKPAPAHSPRSERGGATSSPIEGVKGRVK